MSKGQVSADQPVSQKRALLYALGTHLIWGALPIYLLLVHEVPPLEFVFLIWLFVTEVCSAV